MMSAEKQYDFSACFEKLSGVAHTVSSEAAAADKIVSIFNSKKARCVALAGLSDSLAAKIEKLCNDITLLKEPYAADTLQGAIDAADVGVTGIDVYHPLQLPGSLMCL